MRFLLGIALALVIAAPVSAHSPADTCRSSPDPALPGAYLVTERGLDRAGTYNLWAQVLDASGRVVANVGTDAGLYVRFTDDHATFEYYEYLSNGGVSTVVYISPGPTPDFIPADALAFCLI